MDFNRNSFQKSYLTRKSHDVKNVPGTELEKYISLVSNIEKFEIWSEAADIYQHFWIELRNNFRVVIHIQKNQQLLAKVIFNVKPDLGTSKQGILSFANNSMIREPGQVS